MKYIWMFGCIFVAVDMMPIALGEEPSAFLHADWQWLTWLPIFGWLVAAYRAAVANVGWIE